MTLLRAFFQPLFMIILLLYAVSFEIFFKKSNVFVIGETKLSVG